MVMYEHLLGLEAATKVEVLSYLVLLMVIILGRMIHCTESSLVVNKVNM